MLLKNEIKNQLEKLDEKELKIVEKLLNSITSRKSKPEGRPKNPSIYYKKVIELMKESRFSTMDIDLGRQERL
jgi:hypothetical protein